MFLLSGDWYVWELLELPQRCQGHFRGSRGKVGFISRCRSGIWPHLAFKGEYAAFPRVAPTNLGSLSSYDGDLRDPLMGPQERSVSVRGSTDLCGFLCSCCHGRGPHLELRLEPQGSSPMPTWISGFLWGFHRGVRPRFVWRHARPLYSRAGKAVSGFLSG